MENSKKWFEIKIDNQSALIPLIYAKWKDEEGIWHEAYQLNEEIFAYRLIESITNNKL